MRRETYELDLGQTGWMTAEEFHSFFPLLNLHASSRVLEVGCGAGGCAVYLAQAVGAEVTGLDVNENVDLQEFLACVQTVSRERRLSRFLYATSKPANGREPPRFKT